MKNDKLKDKLIDSCIEEIKDQLNLQDETAIDELLRFVPVKNLIQFLSEKKWKQFEPLLKEKPTTMETNTNTVIEVAIEFSRQLGDNPHMAIAEWRHKLMDHVDDFLFHKSEPVITEETEDIDELVSAYIEKHNIRSYAKRFTLYVSGNDGSVEFFPSKEDVRNHLKRMAKEMHEDAKKRDDSYADKMLQNDYAMISDWERGEPLMEFSNGTWFNVFGEEAQA